MKTDLNMSFIDELESKKYYKILKYQVRNIDTVNPHQPSYHDLLRKI